MKKLLWLLCSITLYASNPDPDLLNYQARYSFCHEKSNEKIAECLLNGNLNYSHFSGERFPRRSIDKSALSHGNAYKYVIRHLPHSKRYLGLRQYLDYLYSIKDQYQPPRFKGNKDEDIIRIKKIFNLLRKKKIAVDPLYTQEFVDALKWYQRTHGLLADGKLGRATKRSLKRSIGSIILKVKKNLVIESLSYPKPSTYILVNIPEFKMHFYRNGRPILDMRVIVGKTKLKTPVFHRQMKYVVLNPRWVVPDSIYKKEYAHKSKSYLKSHRFAFDSNGHLYQKPGKRNSLGIVKFLFPNGFNVYMHDTPTKRLFNRNIRAYSHGCIRLQKPLSLLKKLGYSYKPGKTKWIPLKRTIPVYIEYHTVWVDDRGVVQFRPDIYGYERSLFSGATRKVKRKRSDILDLF